MKLGRKFNFKVEKAAEGVLKHLYEKQFSEAFELADKNLKKKKNHPVFLFADSIRYLINDDPATFREIFDKISLNSGVKSEDYYNFGVFFQALDVHSLAAECYGECINLKPDFVEGYIQLANSLFSLNEVEGALGSYLSVLEIDKENKYCLDRAGSCYELMGHNDKALECYRKLYDKDPLDSNYRCNVAKCLIHLERSNEAEHVVSKDLEKASKKELDYLLLVKLYKDRHDMKAALNFAAVAYDENKDCLPVIKIFGSLLCNRNLFEKAQEVLLKAIARDPNDPEMLFNYGNACQKLGELTEAHKYYLKSLEADPQYHKAINNLGFVFEALGDHKQALECYAKALKMAPDQDKYHSNILFAMLHESGSDPIEHYNEARKWEQSFAVDPADRIAEYKVSNKPQEKLKIAYISGDFGDHVASYHWLPIVKHHDRDKFEIFLYSQTTREDETSEKVRTKIDEVCDHNIEVVHMSDEQLCDQIVNDGINVLIDLSGHTAGNRLTALSRKPAPVQATYIGYPATTGLDAIDYFITQPIHTPITAARAFSEKLVHTVGCTSYNIRSSAEHVVSKPLPFKENGYVTFGSFNRPSKVSKECIDAWVKIAAGVPNSRLIIKSDGVTGDRFKNVVTESMNEAGVSSERLIFRERSEYADYLEEINEIDIGLDPFPYNGATTSFDMLFMGRSYITLRGAGAIHEIVGASYLEYFGHPELVANTIEEYVNKAITAAKGVQDLEAIRGELKETFLRDIAGSGPRVCASLEAGYQKMWDTYVLGKEKDHINVA
ncbi:MAG: tetratricopeptide repeat protein [Halopseudomonas aestusnigri]